MSKPPDLLDVSSYAQMRVAGMTAGLIIRRDFPQARWAMEIENSVDRLYMLSRRLVDDDETLHALLDVYRRCARKFCGLPQEKVH